MKKLLCAVLCLLLIVSAMPAFARGVDVMVVVNCNEYVSLRQNPDTKATVLRKVHLGEFVYNCSDMDGTFTRCTFDGVTGYILSKYLNSTNYTNSTPTIRNQMVVNCDEYVSLRETPDTKASRLVKVPKYAVVTRCLRYNEEWIYCTYSGKTGYVLSKYLTTADYDYIASIKTKTETETAAETPDYPELPTFLTVTGVSEWATMRDRPSTTGQQVTRVPLGAIVEDCVQVSDTFVSCSYNGYSGYIRIDLLKELKAFDSLSDKPSYTDMLNCGNPDIAASTANGYSVLVQHDYSENKEQLLAVCYDSSMQPLWSAREEHTDIGELAGLSAFIAGTAAEPLLVIYKYGYGFIAYKIGAQKTVAWTSVSGAAAYIGGGITTAVDTDGTIYALGYYGSELLCLNSDGTVRWKTPGKSNLYWPFEISITGDGIEVYYDSCTADDSKCYKAVYSQSGSLSYLTKVSPDTVMYGTMYVED